MKTIVARESGAEIEVTFNGTREDGSPISIKYIVSKEAGPIKYLEGGPAEGTTVNTKKISDHTMDFTTAREGKQVLAQHAVVSADGKALRVTVKGINADGQPVEGWVAFDSNNATAKLECPAKFVSRCCWRSGAKRQMAGGTIDKPLARAANTLNGSSELVACMGRESRAFRTRSEHALAIG